MGLCAPDQILGVRNLFYCQDNWLLLGLGALVLLVLAALAIAVTVIYFASLIQMVNWWNEGKEREEKTIEELTQRVQSLETILNANKQEGEVAE